MKSILSAVSLFVLLSGTARPQDRSEELRTEILIDGVAGGFVRKWEGGELRAPVALETPGGKKRLGSLRCAPLTVEVTFPPSPALVEWIQQTLSGSFARKTVVMNMLDASLRPVRGFKASQCYLIRIAFPTSDAASTTPAFLSLSFLPESSQPVSGEPVRSTATPDAANRAASQRSFRFAFEDSTDARGLLKVEGLTVTLKTALTEPAGEERICQVSAAGLEISNFMVTLPETLATGWKDWYQNFVVAGFNDDAREKTGSLSYLSSDLSRSLFTVKLKNVGIAGLADEQVPAGTMVVRRLKAELYAEGLDVSVPGADASGAATPRPADAPAPPPLAPAPAPAPSPAPAPPPSTPPPPAPAPAPAPSPAPAPAATPYTHKDDQGARDPADFPRPEGTLRKSYTSGRNKILSTEIAAYAAKLPLSKLEAAFEGMLKQGGWETSGRNESGDPGKNTHVISLSLKKASRTAQLNLDQAKDGTSQYTVTLSVPAELPLRPRGLPEK